MTDMEKKVAFLLATSPYLEAVKGQFDEAARDLVRNGVTVQKWIPVTERLPERGKKVLCYHQFSGEEWTDWEDTICENAFNGFCVGSGERKVVWAWQGDFVTHWMPLPEPPKGE